MPGEMQNADEISDFHDQQVPSCYSKEGMTHAMVEFSVVPLDIFQHILELDA